MKRKQYSAEQHMSPVAHGVHSDCRPLLADYFWRACNESAGKHTPHLLDETLLWNRRCVESRGMR